MKVLLWALVFLIIGLLTWLSLRMVDEYYQSLDDPMLHKLRDVLAPVHPDIAHVEMYKGEKSYTINKQRIYLCLRDEHNKYYDMNMLIYVFLHEFAHYLNKEDIGHTEKFHAIFDKLLEKAQSLGVYDASIPPIQDYCNHTHE